MNIEKCDNNGKWSEYTVPYTKRKETYRYRYCDALEADTSVDEGDYNSCILEEMTKTTWCYLIKIVLGKNTMSHILIAKNDQPIF